MDGTAAYLFPRRDYATTQPSTSRDVNYVTGSMNKNHSILRVQPYDLLRNFGTYSP